MQTQHSLPLTLKRSVSHVQEVQTPPPAESWRSTWFRSRVRRLAETKLVSDIRVAVEAILFVWRVFGLRR